MPNRNHQTARTLLIVALLSPLGGMCSAQSTGASTIVPEKTQVSRSIEDLNLLGSDTAMPPISDSLLGVESGFRRALFSEGILLRANALPRVSLNVLDGAVPADQQVYIGQRPTWITGLNPILTADLRQLHLHHAQLNIGAGWRWTSWNPAGPKSFGLSSLYFYKMWGDRRVEMKAGYIGNDLEFVGMQVGGSTSTGAQGVYAVLPYEVGMSYFPLPAPSINVRLQGPGRTYFKTAAQRSLDPGGGLVTEARNHTGFRFIPKGDGLLLIEEGGYNRPSSAAGGQAWLRAGYMRNSTLYTDRATGLKESGNYCAFVLMDYQVRMPDPQTPGHGFYIGGTAMTVPSRFNAYDRYYEARAYQKAPFRWRPDDVFSVVASYRGHSKYFTGKLAADGKTVWHSATSLTGNYSIHLSPGNYLTVALGYLHGPAMSPRVADPLLFTVNWGLYL